MKQCKTCEQIKPLSDFYKLSKSRQYMGDGHANECKACIKIRQSTPEAMEAKRINDKKYAVLGDRCGFIERTDIAPCVGVLTSVQELTHVSVCPMCNQTQTTVCGNVACPSMQRVT